MSTIIGSEIDEQFGLQSIQCLSETDMPGTIAFDAMAR